MSDDELIERVARALADVSYTGANIVLDAQLAEGEVQEMACAVLPLIYEAEQRGYDRAMADFVKVPRLD